MVAAIARAIAACPLPTVPRPGQLQSAQAALYIGVVVWLIVVYTGAYNVAATDWHGDAVRWTLDTTMDRSAANRATAVNLPELVRSQATVSRSSYMRAMIPHHSIAIMTYERAQIREPPVQKLAHDIIEAQRREIAQMRYLIAALASGHTVESIYRDPPAEPGTVEDALSQVPLSQLDLAPMPEAEAHRVLDADTRCTFNRSPESNPILSADRGGGAAVKLNRGS